MSHLPLKPQMRPTISSMPRVRVSYFYMSALLTLTAAAALLALGAQAQTAEPAAAPAAAASQAAAPALASTPKYAARDIERVFNFLDTNRDGKISRAEAAGFRNVAKHFDAADTNKDNMLSREEFENALNGDKPQ